MRVHRQTLYTCKLTPARRAPGSAAARRALARGQRPGLVACVARAALRAPDSGPPGLRAVKTGLGEETPPRETPARAPKRSRRQPSQEGAWS